MSSPIFIHETAIVDPNCNVGEGTKIWHFTHVMKSKIGANCNIGQNVFIANDVTIGNNVKIQNNVSLYTGVTCEDYVFIGPSVVFTNILNPRSEVIRRNQYVTTLIQHGATLGANSTIVCGITIGKYALIGAGAVVTKSVPEYALLVGNPAKQIGWVSRYGNTLKFNNNGIAQCPETLEEYKLVDIRVALVEKI